jgi:hypothetical protein
VRRGLFAPILIATACIVASAASARARAEDDHPPPRASLEIDLVPYVFRGYSAHVGVVPLPHVRATIGVFGNHFPAQSVDNWDLKTPWAIVAAVGGYWRADARGIGAGIVSVVARHELGIFDQTVKSTEWSVGPFVTYAWFPFDALGFYLRPWGAILPRVSESGSRTVGPNTYDESSVAYVLALHVGWEIGP